MYSSDRKDLLKKNAKQYSKRFFIEKDLLTWYFRLCRKFWGILICGQWLSLLLCATGVASQKLVIACGVKIPGFIAFCGYMLLAIVFTTKLVWKTEEAKLIFKERWWKYIIIAVVDVYANFLVFTAYEYTSLTSVQVSTVITSFAYFCSKSVLTFDYILLYISVWFKFFSKISKSFSAFRLPHHSSCGIFINFIFESKV